MDTQLREALGIDRCNKKDPEFQTCRNLMFDALLSEKLFTNVTTAMRGFRSDRVFVHVTGRQMGTNATYSCHHYLIKPVVLSIPI